MTTMQAAVVTALRNIECREVPAPEPQPGRVLVKILMASICGTDLHYVYHGWPRDNYPLAPGEPGHEGVGVVVDGRGTPFEEGDRVLTVPSIWEARNFADYQLIGPHFLAKLPDGPELSHLLMAQQLGTVIFAARKLPNVDGATVVVIGQGSAGLFHDFWLRRMGAGRIITVEPNKERRDAGRAFDVSDAIDVTGQAATNAVLDLTGGEGADVVVDAVGGGETMNQSIAMVRKLGYIHLFGLPTSHEPVPFDLPRFFLKHLDMGTIFGAQDEPGLHSFRLALELIERREIDMTPMVTDVFPLERVKEAFALAREPRGGALKVSLSMG
jgi:L-iditol 2-dehydrogenase